MENWEKLKEKPKILQKNSMKKFLFQEELEAYKRLRNENKATKLLKAVFQSITTTLSIEIDGFSAKFFEFPLKNTFAEPINCLIDMDNIVKPVTDVDEWKFYKKKNNIGGNVEGNLVDKSVNNKDFVYLKAMETLMIPFKVDLFNGNFDNPSMESFESKVRT